MSMVKMMMQDVLIMKMTVNMMMILKKMWVHKTWIRSLNKLTLNSPPLPSSSSRV